MGLYGAFTFHPGLRRISNHLEHYRPYARFGHEIQISQYGQTLGHREAMLENTYARHIGFEHSTLDRAAPAN